MTLLFLIEWFLLLDLFFRSSLLAMENSCGYGMPVEEAIHS